MGTEIILSDILVVFQAVEPRFRVIHFFIYFLEYNPPNPQPGQGVHRIYFFVFEQKARLMDGIHIANRCGFNVDGFMRDFDLKPVAMNMFRSEFPDIIIEDDMIIT